MLYALCYMLLSSINHMMSLAPRPMHAPEVCCTFSTQCGSARASYALKLPYVTVLIA